MNSSTERAAALNAAKRRRILIADDTEAMRELVVETLDPTIYEVITAVDGQDAVQKYKAARPELVLLDRMMPKLDGIEVCRYIKGDHTRGFVPVVMITAVGSTAAKIEGFDAGADDYLTKPFSTLELEARVRAWMRIRTLQEEVNQLNQDLEARVARQVLEIDRVNRLRRYLAPGLVESVMAGGESALELTPRRKELTILFLDIRNFTTISDQLEPDEVSALLAEYLSRMTRVMFNHGGTVNKFLGDGIMVFFGDPVPQPDHRLRAVRAALEARDQALALQAEFHSRLPEELWVGCGVHTGTATVGILGHGPQLDYTAVGSSVNLAARLQSLSVRNEVICSAAVFESIRAHVVLRGERRETIKGFAHPIHLAEIIGLS